MRERIPDKSDGNFTPNLVRLPVDFTECSWQAFQYTMQVDKAFQCSVTLMHAVGRPSHLIECKSTHPIGNLTFEQQIEMRLSQ